MHVYADERCDTKKAQGAWSHPGAGGGVSGRVGARCDKWENGVSLR